MLSNDAPHRQNRWGRTRFTRLETYFPELVVGVSL